MCLTILCIQMCDNSTYAELGCPIRISPDQSLLGGSPRLFAACYVLHRLLESRHPPCAFVTAFIVCPINPCSFRNTNLSDVRLSIGHFLSRPTSSLHLHSLVFIDLFASAFRRKTTNPDCQGAPFCGNENPHRKIRRLSTKKN